VCHPDFLLRTVPHLYDLDTMSLSKETALFQTPQTFWNETQLVAMLMEAAQFFFIKLMLPSASGCGVGFLLWDRICNAKRGFGLSLALFSKGYKGKFPLTRVLTPASLQELFDQRLRWTYGN
jgi:hypothetical protein